MSKWTHTIPEVFPLCYEFSSSVFVYHLMSISKIKSLSSIIRCRYGNHVLKVIQRYQKLDNRMKKCDLEIKFLNTCQNNDLCPTYIQYKISLMRLQNSNAYRQSQRLFIPEELTFKNVEQENIILEMERIKSDLRMVINLLD